MRIVELPLKLCPAGKLSLAVLAARESALGIGYSVYVGSNYSLSGEPVISFEPLDAGSRFAQVGILVADYPAETRTADETGSLIVSLTGVDVLLDEEASFRALADELLVFIGDEIMSVMGIDLLAANTYRLQVIRNRMATPRETHSAGAEVWIIAKADLLALQHPQFEPGNMALLKVMQYESRHLEDLGDVDQVEHQITGRIFTEPALANLASNGSRRNAIYATGADIELSWNLTQPFADHYKPNNFRVQTQLDFLAEADFPGDPADLDDPDSLNLASSFVEDGEVAALTNAELILAIGGETDFYVFARRIMTGPEFILKSRPIRLLVEKV